MFTGRDIRELKKFSTIFFWNTLIVVPVVTIYATLGDDAIAHGINETEVSTVITTHDLLPKFRKILVKTPKVR